MEDALKKMAFKPNLKEINETSTISKRLKTKFWYGAMMKRFYTMKQPVIGPTAMEIGSKFAKANNWTLLFSAAILGLGFYSSVLVTMVRKDAFQRNYSHIE